MPNSGKIPGQLKKFFIQEFEFDKSVCMAAVSFSCLVSAVATNEQTDTVKSTQNVPLVIYEYVHIYAVKS